MRLPKKMALELFKPFIYNKLEERQMVATIKQREGDGRGRGRGVDILEEVIREHPVLLNRAHASQARIQPSSRCSSRQGDPDPPARLHGVQCDFDGDQMAVHIPLSPESQIERRC